MLLTSGTTWVLLTAGKNCRKLGEATLHWIRELEDKWHFARAEEIALTGLWEGSDDHMKSSSLKNSSGGHFVWEWCPLFAEGTLSSSSGGLASE